MMSEYQPETKSSENAPIYRACEYCRMHKQRCLPDDTSSAGHCQRCVRTGRTCVFASRPDRKPRKRTDARVAELERQVRAMKAIIQSQSSPKGNLQDQDSSGPTASLVGLESKRCPMEQPKRSPDLGPAGMDNHYSSKFDSWQMENSAWQSSQPSTGPTGDPQNVGDSSSIPSKDVIDRGVISQEMALELTQIYNKDLYPHYPVVPLPRNMGIQDFRVARPNLFLAVLAAAAGRVSPRLHSVLTTELLHAYAVKIVVDGEKTLELVQAMIVTTVWYFPSDRHSRLKVYQYIHMAAAMALDIGLGSRPSESRKSLDLERIGDSSIESWRTILACYHSCSGVSTNMRRPNMLRYNDWIEDCVHGLESTLETGDFDLLITAWAKLQRIVEEITVSLNHDDTSQAIALEESRVKLLLKSFMKQLETWRADLAPNLFQASLVTMYHAAKIVLHEVLLYSDHPPSDFRPPHPSETLRIVRSTVYPAPSSEGLAIIISSSQALLQVFIDLEVEQIISLPTMTVVRVRYATYVLCKLFVSVQDPTSSIGRLIDPESLQLDYFLPLLVAKLQTTAEPPGSSVLSLFLGLFEKFYRWYLQQTGEPVDALDLEGEPRWYFDPSPSESNGQQPNQAKPAGMHSAALADEDLLFEGFDGDYGNILGELDLFDSQQVAFSMDWN